MEREITQYLALFNIDERWTADKIHGMVAEQHPKNRLIPCESSHDYTILYKPSLK